VGIEIEAVRLAMSHAVPVRSCRHWLYLVAIYSCVVGGAPSDRYR